MKKFIRMTTCMLIAVSMILSGIPDAFVHVYVARAEEISEDVLPVDEAQDEGSSEDVITVDDLHSEEVSDDVLPDDEAYAEADEDEDAFSEADESDHDCEEAVEDESDELAQTMIGYYRATDYMDLGNTYIDDIPPVKDGYYIWIKGKRWTVFGENDSRKLLIMTESIEAPTLEAAQLQVEMYNSRIPAVFDNEERDLAVEISRDEVGQRDSSYRIYRVDNDGNYMDFYNSPFENDMGYAFVEDFEDRYMFMMSLGESCIYPESHKYLDENNDRDPDDNREVWTRTKTSQWDGMHHSRNYWTMQPWINPAYKDKPSPIHAQPEDNVYGKSMGVRPAFEMDSSKYMFMTTTGEDPDACKKTEHDGEGVFGDLITLSDKRQAKLTIEGKSSPSLFRAQIEDFDGNSVTGKIGQGTAAGTVDIGKFVGGKPITINYQNFTPGSNNYIGAALYNCVGELVKYASFKPDQSSGSWDLVMPAESLVYIGRDDDEGSERKYTLKIFEERRGGAHQSDKVYNISSFDMTYWLDFNFTVEPEGAGTVIVTDDEGVPFEGNIVPAGYDAKISFIPAEGHYYKYCRFSEDSQYTWTDDHGYYNHVSFSGNYYENTDEQWGTFTGRTLAPEHWWSRYRPGLIAHFPERSYHVRFLDSRGSTLEEKTYGYGDTPEYTGRTDLPDRDINRYRQWRWTGNWYPEIAQIDSTTEPEIDYRADYDWAYNIFFYNEKYDYNGNYTGKDLIGQTVVWEGETPVYTGETPVRPPDKHYTYTFKGWDREPAPFLWTDDCEYYARYEPAQRVAGADECWIYADPSPEAGGTVTGADIYNLGDTVTLTAKANDAYEFDGWTEDGEIVSTDAVYSFTAEEERTLTAVFVRIYPVTVNGGSGDGEYREGAAVTIKADRPLPGMEFDEWTGTDGLTFTSGSEKSSEAVFTMPAHDVEIESHYADIPGTEYMLWIEDIPDACYTGSAIKPEPAVHFGDMVLLGGRDYTVSYKNNVAAADAGSDKAPAVVVKGKGNYDGTAEMTFTISKLDIGNARADDISVAFKEGKEQRAKPKVTYMLGNKNVTLKEGTDYVIEWEEGKDYISSGDYVTTVKGIGNYTGELEVHEYIAGAGKTLMTKASVAKIPDQTYTGNSIIFSVMKEAAEDGEVFAADKNGQNFAFTVTCAQKPLTYGTDYSIELKNNKEIGTASVTIRGMGDYAGTKTAEFKITGTSMSSVTFPKDFAFISGYDTASKSFLYSGTAFYAAGAEKAAAAATNNGYVLRYGNAELTNGVDYTVEYRNNTLPGTAEAVFTGKNRFTGSVKKSFKISAYPISGYRIDVEMPGNASYEYAAGGAMPEPKLFYTYGNGEPEELVNGRDYTLKWSNNTAVAASTALKPPTVTITGKGTFAGSRSEKFSIIGSSISSGSVTIDAKDVVFAAKPGICKSVLTLTDRYTGGKLNSGKDYESAVIYSYAADTTVQDASQPIYSGKTVTGYNEAGRAAGTVVDQTKDIIPAGTKINVTVTGKGPYRGSGREADKITGSFYFIEKANDLSKATITIASKAYTGKKITLTDGDISFVINKVPVDLVLDDDYVIIEQIGDNYIDKGSHKVTIKGNGAKGYGFSKTVSFSITARTMDYSISFDANEEGLLDEIANAMHEKDASKTPEEYKAEIRTDYKISGTMKPSVITNDGKLPKCGFTVLHRTIGSKGETWTAVSAADISFREWTREEDGSGQAFSNGGVFKPSWISRLLYGVSFTLHAQWNVQL